MLHTNYVFNWCHLALQVIKRCAGGTSSRKFLLLGFSLSLCLDGSQSQMWHQSSLELKQNNVIFLSFQKVVIDAFRLINANMMVLGHEPRQTTSNLGHLNKPSIQVHLSSCKFMVQIICEYAHHIVQVDSNGASYSLKSWEFVPLDHFSHVGTNLLLTHRT